MKYSKATDATGDDFRKSLYKKFLAKEDNKNISESSAADTSRNINISFQSWVDVMYEILGAMDDNKILDLDHADLSKAFFRMTENEDLVKGENQISVNAFLEYINKLNSYIYAFDSLSKKGARFSFLVCTLHMCIVPLKSSVVLL